MNKSSPRWSDLRTRLVSAVILVCVAGVCLWQGGFLYDVLILLAMVGLVWEGELLIQQPLRTWRGVLLLLWPIVAGVSALKGQWLLALGMLIPAMAFGVKTSIPVIVSVVGGLSLLWLRHRGAGLESVLFVLSVVVASDSCAYLSGRIFGGPKLAPSISPGKTRSGALGGLLGASLAGGCVAWLTSGHLIIGGLFWGAVLGVFSQSGDLLESAVKRRLGVKDSGYIIPGHGGLLDRFDGLLAAAPVAALLSLFVSGHAFWAFQPVDLVSGSAHYTISQGSFSHE
ncbi:phosphatidate cytidylyltransferase [Swingsia samuiensis]|uniref:Phosphatidate cytidylyltransferase n=1 Tax=Swingsia samuiensis TaxID=1293412 RepID=A0A4Y6UKC7_9PROT|nr:phosphatidate cytidylyltransferase [Swingsia samuiensis]QDH17524.1 phosphatidate cytidylyltransferase [Swingsia samuiensis]